MPSGCDEPVATGIRECPGAGSAAEDSWKRVVDLAVSDASERASDPDRSQLAHLGSCSRMSSIHAPTGSYNNTRLHPAACCRYLYPDYAVCRLSSARQAAAMSQGFVLRRDSSHGISTRWAHPLVLNWRDLRHLACSNAPSCRLCWSRSVRRLRHRCSSAPSRGVILFKQHFVVTRRGRVIR